MAYKILQGSVADQIKTLPDESVQTVITSPPYWGLRDYGTAKWEGGDANCDHKGRSQTSSASSLGEWKSGGGQRYKEATGGMPFAGTCGKCGAIRIDDQIGLEETPDEYINKLVAIFREVRRVLRNDGTLWLNIGDTYSAGSSNPSPKHSSDNVGMNRSVKGIPPKNLIGTPWMLAFALRADGWYLRQDIIWHKGNAMPESVTDRCTKSHEHLFLLSKSPYYHFDNKAIQEDAVTAKSGNSKRVTPAERDCPIDGEGAMGSGVPWVGTKRNKRDVWSISTQPYKGAHFAVFPEKLVEPCILAGSKEGDTVLDPFCGSGTVGLVAKHYRRDFIGIDLNPDYIELAHARIAVGSKKLDTYIPAEEANDKRTSGTGEGGGDAGANGTSTAGAGEAQSVNDATDVC